MPRAAHTGCIRRCATSRLIQRFLPTARDNLGDESVVSLTDSALGRLKLAILYRMGEAPLKLYRDRRPLIFSTGIDGLDFTRHPAYVSADLVHLHWVSGLVSTRVLRKNQEAGRLDSTRHVAIYRWLSPCPGM